MFKSGSSNIEWVLALDFGNCKHACGELECAEDMFAKVKSQHAFEAILESIDNAPGCNSYKVDTEYGAAPFIWEDNAQCWVSGADTGTTCGTTPDLQFTDVRLCPCKKEAGKDVAREATDALESSPADEDAAMALGREQALMNLHEAASVPAFLKVPAPGVVACVAALVAVVGASGMMGVAAWRARRREGGSRLLSCAENDEGVAEIGEC